MEVVTPRWILESDPDQGYVKEIDKFQKDSLTVLKTTIYKMGKWFCIQPYQPFINLDNPDGFNLLVRPEKWRLIILSRMESLDWTYPENLNLLEKSNIITKWDHTYYEGLASIGWYNVEKSITLYGKLNLEKTFEVNFTCN